LTFFLSSSLSTPFLLLDLWRKETHRGQREYSLLLILPLPPSLLFSMSFPPHSKRNPRADILVLFSLIFFSFSFPPPFASPCPPSAQEMHSFPFGIVSFWSAGGSDFHDAFSSPRAPASRLGVLPHNMCYRNAPWWEVALPA